MDEAERDLIRRAQGGDGWAFEQLVCPYDRPVLAMARDMVGDLADAQDVYQEALLAAYRGLRKFRMDSSFSTWLYRVTVNHALRFRHRRQRRHDIEEAGGADAADQPSVATDADLLKQELQRQLDHALEDLSRQERSAFVLCHRQGLRIDAAADIMECSSGAVKSYLFRARDKVKKTLAPYLEHE